MPANHVFDYAVIRVVPYVERDEFINAGVILFCKTLRFLDARIDLNVRRLLALAPGADVERIHAQLEAMRSICGGAGPIGRLSQSERFHWLTAPRSTIIQTSPVHCGLCDDPQATLDHLLETLVSPQ